MRTGCPFLPFQLPQPPHTQHAGWPAAANGTNPQYLSPQKQEPAHLLLGDAKLLVQPKSTIILKANQLISCAPPPPRCQTAPARPAARRCGCAGSRPRPRPCTPGEAVAIRYALQGRDARARQTKAGACDEQKSLSLKLFLGQPGHVSQRLHTTLTEEGQPLARPALPPHPSQPPPT